MAILGKQRRKRRFRQYYDSTAAAAENEGMRMVMMLHFFPRATLFQITKIGRHSYEYIYLEVEFEEIT